MNVVGEGKKKKSEHSIMDAYLFVSSWIQTNVAYQQTIINLKVFFNGGKLRVATRIKKNCRVKIIFIIISRQIISRN